MNPIIGVCFYVEWNNDAQNTPKAFIAISIIRRNAYLIGV
jgi:hypothetical protein